MSDGNHFGYMQPIVPNAFIENQVGTHEPIGTGSSEQAQKLSTKVKNDLSLQQQSSIMQTDSKKQFPINPTNMQNKKSDMMELYRCYCIAKLKYPRNFVSKISEIIKKRKNINLSFDTKSSLKYQLRNARNILTSIEQEKIMKEEMIILLTIPIIP